MAQLRDLIVNGPARFLGKAIYNHNVLFTKDVTFDCDILPGSSNRNVGSDASPWKNIYVETLNTEGLVTTGGDASTSTATGDIQVAGGIGVARTSFFADKIYNGSTTYYIDGDETSVLYALTLKNALTVDDVTTLKKKLTVSDGGITVTKGGIGVTAGGVTITAGHLTLAAGNNITLAKGNIVSTEGDLTLTKGNLTLSSGNASIVGKVTITNGDAYDGTKYDLKTTGGIWVVANSYFADKIYTGTYNSDATKAYYIDGDSTSRLYALNLVNNLAVGGDTSVTTLTASKKITISGSASGVANTTTVFEITKGSAVMTDGSLTLTKGDITLTKGNQTFAEGNLTLTKGNLTLTAGNLSVTGTSALNGKTTITNGDAYDGTKYDLKVTGGIWVVKNSYFADKIYTGTYNSDATKAYYIEGDSTSRLNNLQLAGTLNVAGTTTLKATTTTTLSATNISCTTLTSTGQITAGNKLVVSAGGAVISAGGLTVTGASTFNNGVSITTGDDYSYNGTTRSADLQVAGGVSIRKKLNVGTNLMIADKAVMSYDSSDECLYFSFA